MEFMHRILMVGCTFVVLLAGGPVVGQWIRSFVHDHGYKFGRWDYLLAASALFLLFHSGAVRAETPDIARCAQLAGAYHNNPFALKVGELDELRQCISWQMSEMVRGKELERLERAIHRNFARDEE